MIKEKVIVTGGAGFIGSQLVDKLIERGNRVIIVDDMSTGDPRFVNKEARLEKLDVWFDHKKFKKLIMKEKPSVIFHLAGQKDVAASVDDPVKDAQINIVGTLNVLTSINEAGGGRVVFASTAAVYSPTARLPVNEKSSTAAVSPYGISKRAAEKYLWMYSNVAEKVAAISLRMSNAYGPRQSEKAANATTIFMQRMMDGQSPTIFGSGEQTRDFIYVDDIVEAMIRAANVAWCGEMNIGTGEEVSINQLVDIIGREVGMDAESEYLDAKEGELMQSRLDVSLAREVMGWSPQVSIEEGIKRTVAWNRANEDKK